MTARRSGIPATPTGFGELDAQQAHFVAALYDLGGSTQDGPQAALIAGYADDYDEAARCARILLKSPKILKAMREAMRQRFDALVGLAARTLESVAADPKAPANARIAAAESILNRSSVGPVPSRSVSFQATSSVDELIKRLDAEERGQASTIEGSSSEVQD